MGRKCPGPSKELIRPIERSDCCVELGGVSVYLSEIATPGHEGFFVSWQSASQQPAVMLAAIFGIVLSSTLPPAAMDA
jgi:hypothetical protein